MEKIDVTQRLRPRGGGIPGIVIGFTYPLRALRLFQQHKSLRPYVIVPLVINILLGVVLYSLGIWWGRRVISDLTLRLTTWLEPAWLDTTVELLAPVIQFVLILGLFVILGFVLLQFGGILGSPFYGQLSEKIEILRAGKLELPESLGLATILIDIWRAILFELKKLLLLVVIGLPLLLLNFLPGLGTLFATGSGIALAALLICLDMFDAPLERRRLKFRQKTRHRVSQLARQRQLRPDQLFPDQHSVYEFAGDSGLRVSGDAVFFCDRILPTPPRGCDC